MTRSAARDLREGAAMLVLALISVVAPVLVFVAVLREGTPER